MQEMVMITDSSEHLTDKIIRYLLCMTKSEIYVTYHDYDIVKRSSRYISIFKGL